MNDFLKQLRSGGGKRFDRTRRPYEGTQYRNSDRQNSRDRKGAPHRKNYDHGQLQGIKRILEALADGQKSMADFAKRQTLAEERIAGALESLNAWLSNHSPADTPAPPEKESAPAPPVPAPQSDAPADSHPQEAETGRDAVVKIIVDMRDKGARFEEIARHLTAEHIPTLSGKGQWRAQAVSRLFNRRDT